MVVFRIDGTPLCCVVPVLKISTLLQILEPHRIVIDIHKNTSIRDIASQEYLQLLQKEDIVTL